LIQAKGKMATVVRFHEGEDLLGGLAGLGLKAAAIVCGIGMVRDLVLGYWDGHRYIEERFSQPVELVALQGNVGESEQGKVVVHVHGVVGKEGGATVSGHLLAASVHNTAEVVVLPLRDVRMVRRGEPSGLTGLYPEVDPRATAR